MNTMILREVTMTAHYKNLGCSMALLTVKHWRLLAAVALLATVSSAQQARYRHHGAAALPDPAVTPGKVATSDTYFVCNRGSTRQYRLPGIQAVYKLYGAVKVKGKCCEIDHLVPLELGGANDIKNEWPQPYEPRPGAREKDKVENWLHVQVCSGAISLAEAQAEIVTDWYDIYLKMEAATQ
jgi:hypothetical protein